ncbi:MAG: acyl carrier protein [Gammaproteobacteria bacterium]
MSQAANNIEEKFWRIFKRVLNIDDSSGTVTKDGTEEWDSLRHVELIFELETSFDLDVSPDEIVELYSDTDVILNFLHQRTGEQN